MTRRRLWGAAHRRHRTDSIGTNPGQLQHRSDHRHPGALSPHGDKLLSPLARGTPIGHILARVILRFSPACAGNTSGSGRRRFSSAVQPRGRGEHRSDSIHQSDPRGSAPRARGTLTDDVAHEGEDRFSPAGAGNTQAPDDPGEHHPVQPRGRGEHQQTIHQFCRPIGSAPRARGTLPIPDAAVSARRFSPAGAGNTGYGINRSQQSPVQPRGRGEHIFSRLYSTVSSGSAPRARGTLPIHRSPRHGRRFSPAGAGNTCSASCPAISSTVQPRGRGEHHAIPSSTEPCHGSAPRARGTLQFASIYHDYARFSPAGAGNTCPRKNKF